MVLEHVGLLLTPLILYLIGEDFAFGLNVASDKVLLTASD